MMKKRTLTTLSDTIEPVIKRLRLLDALSVSDEIVADEPLITLDSSNENDDNDTIEIMNSPQQQIDDTIVLNSDDENGDDDEEVNVDIIFGSPPSLSDLFNAFISSPLIDNFIETIEIEEDVDDDEVIDLTEDEVNSNCCLSNELEQNTLVNQDDDDQCPVCLETFSELQCTGVDLIITQCQHVMCILCSRRVLAYSSRCPLCRENVHITTLTPYCILT